VAHLARHLAGRSELDVYVVTRAGSLVARELGDRRGVRVVRLPRRGRFELVTRLSWEAMRLPALLSSVGAAGVITFSGMLPRPLRARTLAFLANPVMFTVSPRPANLLRLWAVRRTLERGATALVPSQAMARMVGEATGVTPIVVPLGVDHSTFRPLEEPGTDIAYVADFYPHKRHDLLFSAWARLPPPRPALRLVGNPEVAPRHHAAIVRRARAMSHLGRVTFEAGLPVNGLADVYRRARLTVVPSVHESFCMPLAESLAAGTPAVARDIPVLRETGGPGATYVAGDDPAAWADAMARVVSDDARHAELRAAGLRHARRFSWPKLADVVVDAVGG
jgi:glycosyltransferase involved in cell wall biosynthesis